MELLGCNYEAGMEWNYEAEWGLCVFIWVFSNEGLFSRLLYQINDLLIMVYLTEIILYIRFSDWFGTNQPSLVHTIVIAGNYLGFISD